MLGLAAGCDVALQGRYGLVEHLVGFRIGLIGSGQLRAQLGRRFLGVGNGKLFHQVRRERLGILHLVDPARQQVRRAHVVAHRRAQNVRRGGQRVFRQNIEHRSGNRGAQRIVPAHRGERVGVRKGQVGPRRGKHHQLALQLAAVDLLGRKRTAHRCGRDRLCATGGRLPHGAAAPLPRLLVIGHTRRAQAGQLRHDVLLARAAAARNLARVILRQKRILDGSQNRKRIGKRRGPPLGTSEIPSAQASLDTVFQKRFRLIDEHFQFVSPMAFQKFRRVEVVGQGDGGKLDARMARLGRHGRIDELKRTIGRPLPSRVAVEQVYDAVARVTRKHADMLARERGAQGCHGVGDAALVHGDDVGVPFAHHRHAGGGHGGLRPVEREQHAPLVE